MNVKIDTKEKFTAVIPKLTKITAIMAEELETVLHNILKDSDKHVVINFENVASIDKVASLTIAKMQQLYYDNKRSYVLCNVNNYILDSFRDWEIYSILNITPTESEAWDMIHMEEIERELLDDENLN